MIISIDPENATRQELHKANIDLVRYLLDELEQAGSASFEAVAQDFDYELDCAAKRLALIHTSLAEGWDDERYSIETIELAIRLES